MNIEDHKRIVVDVDGVLAVKDDETEYIDREVNEAVLEQLREYDEEGFYVILYTARNMNSYDGRLGKISANTAKTLHEWLEKHDIPFDEIYFGKPWCGHEGFYIDDKAIRPSEFVEKDWDEIRNLID